MRELEVVELKERKVQTRGRALGGFAALLGSARWEITERAGWLGGCAVPGTSKQDHAGGLFRLRIGGKSSLFIPSQKLLFTHTEQDYAVED
jgi:hypothetical protein